MAWFPSKMIHNQIETPEFLNEFFDNTYTITSINHIGILLLYVLGSALYSILLKNNPIRTSEFTFFAVVMAVFVF